METSRAGRLPARVASRYVRHGTFVDALLTAVALVALVTWQLVTAGPNPEEWDYLFATGALTVLGGLWLARGQPERFSAMLERLSNRDAFKANPPLDAQKVVDLRNELEQRARQWSARGAALLGPLILAVWIIVNAQDERDLRRFDEIAGPLVGLFGGILVGRVVGRMLSHGLLGPFLARRGISFNVSPGHVDGAAGLKPVGDYYVYQALLLAVPAIFLLCWSLLFYLPSFSSRYDTWRETYLALLALTIALEIAAFFAPLWHAHVAMTEAKRLALATADKTLADDIAELRLRLEDILSEDDRSAADDRLERLTERYNAIETMPTWPIDPTLRRRVTLGNAGLVLGLVAEIAALSGFD